MAGERTEKATPKRRSEARKNGQEPRSVEVNSALVLTATFGVMISMGPVLWGRLQHMVRVGLEGIAHPELASIHGLGQLGGIWGGIVLALTVPFVAAASVSGVLANIGQVRPRFALNLLKPDVKRVNPTGGLKRMVSIHALVELVKSLAKVSAVGVVAFLVLWPKLDEMAALGNAAPSEIASFTGGLIIHLAIWVIAIVVLLAVGDLIFQRWKHEKDLKMSKQDIKDESRQGDVAPEIKSAIRRRAREMSRQRMLAAVPSADVVITNPTHFAVALRYGPGSDAPVVVAKGPDLVAFRIREIAEAHDVAIVENPPLARSLYREVEVGQEIPPAFFGAVAEVLAFVYRTSRRALSWA